VISTIEFPNEELQKMRRSRLGCLRVVCTMKFGELTLAKTDVAPVGEMLQTRDADKEAARMRPSLSSVMPAKGSPTLASTVEFPWESYFRTSPLLPPTINSPQRVTAKPSGPSSPRANVVGDSVAGGCAHPAPAEKANVARNRQIVNRIRHTYQRPTTRVTNFLACSVSVSYRWKSANGEFRGSPLRPPPKQSALGDKASSAAGAESLPPSARNRHPQAVGRRSYGKPRS